MITEERKYIKAGHYADAVRQKLSDGHEASDEEVLNICADTVFGAPELRSLDMTEKSILIRRVFSTLRCELEILQDLADDPKVSEIMVNGPDNIFAEREGRIYRQPLAFDSRDQLERVIRRLAARVGREINELNPIVDARLSDGSRINAVASNIAIDGPVLTIRRFGSGRMTMEQLMEKGDISREAASFLQKAVACRYNIFISGGTSSGKTTFLNILSDYIPAEERIIVIEDSAELAIRGHENLVRMEAKRANAQGKGSVDIRELIKSSLRMRPDRIIVGEVRGAEVQDMLQAMNTGHDGSLSTGHANSPRGMISRLETLYLTGSGFPVEAVRSQIAGAIELIIHLARDHHGHRRVMEISEITGMDKGEIELSTLFRYVPGEGLKSCNTLKNTAKMKLYGAKMDSEIH